MKKCRSCSRELPYSSFSHYKNVKSLAIVSCDECKATKKERDRARHRAWAKNNKEHLKEYYKDWSKKNEDEVREYKRNWQKESRANPLKRLKYNYRSRVYKACKSLIIDKTSHTSELLGCDWDFFKSHIESQFKEGMTWDNYGKWHIDHIVPLSSAKCETKLKMLFHYTNTQPLWADENLKKGSNPKLF